MRAPSLSVQGRKRRRVWQVLQCALSDESWSRRVTLRLPPCRVPLIAASFPSRTRAVSDRQAAVDDRESFAQLLVRNRQGRVPEEGVPAHERIETLLPEEFTQGWHFRRGAV